MPVTRMFLRLLHQDHAAYDFVEVPPLRAEVAVAFEARRAEVAADSGAR